MNPHSEPETEPRKHAKEIQQLRDQLANKRYIDALRLVRSFVGHDIRLCEIIDGVLP